MSKLDNYYQNCPFPKPKTTKKKKKVNGWKNKKYRRCKYCGEGNKDLINNITNKAKEKAVKNVAAISDEEVKEMVLKYYELDDTKASGTEVVDILDLI